MRTLILALALVLAPLWAAAAEPFTPFNVVLLQPSSMLEERVPSVDAMADYVKAVQAAAAEAAQASPARQSVGGFIVVAVRPGLQSRVWLDFDALLDLQTRQLLIDRIRAVKPFEALKGPVVFALKVSLWGGKESRRMAPQPAEWKNVKREDGKPLEVGELVERVWGE